MKPSLQASSTGQTLLLREMESVQEEEHFGGIPHWDQTGTLAPPCWGMVASPVDPSVSCGSAQCTVTIPGWDFISLPLLQGWPFFNTPSPPLFWALPPFCGRQRLPN